MYNHQLDAFLKVAELGSFTKAAKEQYVSTSAIQQQINNLENSLEAKLFQRTRRGVKLTPAGEILYEEAPKFIADSQRIRNRIYALEENNQICLGASPVEQCQLFFNWWNLFNTGDTNYRILFKPISGIGSRKEWDDIDMMEGVYVGARCTDSFDFLSLTTVPIVHAVWKDHPLAKKKVLRYEDMRGQTMVMIGGDGLSECLDRLRNQAEESGINVITREYYDISVFTMCAAYGYILQMPLSDQYAQVGMIAIPCDCDYSIPYGFYYRINASSLVEKFISFVKENNNR